MTERSIERYDLSSEDGIPHLAPHATGPWVLYAQHVSTLAAQAEEIRVLRRALIAHRADLHNGSKRPCPTCYQSAHALGIADKVPNSCAYAETDRTALPTPLPARPA